MLRLLSSQRVADACWRFGGDVMSSTTDGDGGEHELGCQTARRTGISRSCKASAGAGVRPWALDPCFLRRAYSRSSKGRLSSCARIEFSMLSLASPRAQNLASAFRSLIRDST